LTVMVACPKSEYSFVFLQGMLNRMSVSYFKYGAIADGFPHNVSALASLQRALEAYVETGNTEYLIDASNYAMIEFMCPSLPGARFVATDSGDALGRVAIDGFVSQERNVVDK
jgi:hypothetical protein